MGGRGKSDAYLFSKENHKKTAFSSYYCLQQSVTRQVIVSRGRSSFCYFSLGQVLRTPAVPNRSSSLPSGGKNALWISLRPGILLPSRRQGTCTGRVVWGPVSHPSWPRVSFPPCRAVLKFHLFSAEKELHSVPERKGINKPCVLTEPTLPPEMRRLQHFSVSHELQDPSCLSSAGNSEAPDAQG